MSYIGKQYWRCVCSCGTVTTVNGAHLRSGHTQSCGCLHKEVTSRVNLVHGYSARREGKRSPEYTTWANMIARCTNPKVSAYADYGARGIKVCERWRSP